MSSFLFAVQNVSCLITIVIIIWYTDIAYLLQPPLFFGTPITSHPPPPFLASTPLPASATYTTGIKIS